MTDEGLLRLEVSRNLDRGRRVRGSDSLVVRPAVLANPSLNQPHTAAISLKVKTRTSNCRTMQAKRARTWDSAPLNS